MGQADIVGRQPTITQLVPSDTVQRQHGKGIMAGLGADFLQLQVHGVDVSVRQHQPGADAERWSAWSRQRFAFDKWITCRLVS